MAAMKLTILYENLNNDWIYPYLRKNEKYITNATSLKDQKTEGKLKYIVYKIHNLLVALTNTFPVFECDNSMSVYAVFWICAMDKILMVSLFQGADSS